ncbi:MAG: hypothetical protein ABL958_13835, partial [Bdellovibrionia bacterium]
MKHFLVGVLAVIASSPVAANDVETREFPASAIKSLELGNLSGDVNISAGQGDKATVTVTKIEFDESCILNLAMNGSTLNIKVDRPDGRSNKSCKVRFDIAIPAQTALHLSVASSDVS